MPQMETSEQTDATGVITWVWFSRAGTTEQGLFSALAALEVIVAVTIYWGYAVWAHTQYHLLVGALVAPLLLLRSDQSTELGIRWFRRFDFDYNEAMSGTSIVDRLINPPRPFAKNKLLNLTVTFFAGALGSIIGLFIIPVLVATPIRITATIYHLPAGVASLATNWWRMSRSLRWLHLPPAVE